MNWQWWGSWWPWAEANQGMLSLAALVLALVIALFENVRANNAEAYARIIESNAKWRDAQDFIEAILRLIAVFETASATAHDQLESGDFRASNAKTPGIFLKASSDCADTLKALIAGAPRQPLLIILATSTLRIFEQGAKEARKRDNPLMLQEHLSANVELCAIAKKALIKQLDFVTSQMKQP